MPIEPGFHLAQLNIALPREPIDSPLLAEFVALLDPVNALADHADGFVWRLQTDAGNATSIKAFGDERLIVNMSVWESLEQLSGFVYGGGHLEVMRGRREKERLAHLREHGRTPYAFTFKAQFRPGQQLLIEDEIGCPA